MPDGSRMAPEAIEARAAIYMVHPEHAAAAGAWLRFQLPAKYGPHDDRLLDRHFQLFARHPIYWTRLCNFFRALQMGDDQGHRQ